MRCKLINACCTGYFHAPGALLCPLGTSASAASALPSVCILFCAVEGLEAMQVMRRFDISEYVSLAHNQLVDLRCRCILRASTTSSSGIYCNLKVASGQRQCHPQILAVVGLATELRICPSPLLPCQVAYIDKVRSCRLPMRRQHKVHYRCTATSSAAG